LHHAFAEGGRPRRIGGRVVASARVALFSALFVAAFGFVVARFSVVLVAPVLGRLALLGRTIVGRVAFASQRRRTEKDRYGNQGIEETHRLHHPHTSTRLRRGGPVSRERFRDAAKPWMSRRERSEHTRKPTMTCG